MRQRVMKLDLSRTRRKSDSLSDNDSDGLQFTPDIIMSTPREMYTYDSFTKVLGTGNYVIKYKNITEPLLHVNNTFFVEAMSPFCMLLLLLVSLASGSLSALPYATYHEWITTTEWVFFCVVRTVTFGIVFTSQWVSIGSGIIYMNRSSSSACHAGRYLVAGMFAVLYAILYCIKWIELSNVVIWQVSIPMFTISWFAVYYSFANYRLGSSTSCASSMFEKRVRPILLSAVKRVEYIVRSDDDNCEKVYASVCDVDSRNIGALFAKHFNTDFYQDHEDNKIGVSGDRKLDMYEDETYDKNKERCTSMADMFVGLVLVPVILALLEDYGYPLHRLCKGPGCISGYDWMAFVLCTTLGILYLVATYDVHHTNMRKVFVFFRSKQDAIECIKRLLTSLLPLALACVIATTRLNSSYSIFGKIAGKFEMPYSLGLPFIYVCVGIVFVVDMTASYKIICRTYKQMLSIVSLSLERYIRYLPWSIGNFLKYYYIRFYCKRLKWIIKTCDNITLTAMFDQLL